MKVGDYIHYHKENYLKYGLSVDKPQSVDPISVLQGQKAEILRSMPFRFDSSKQTIKQQLENEMNYFFQLEQGKVEGWNEQDAQQLQQLMEEICETAASQLDSKLSFNNVDIDWSTLNVTGGQNSISLSSDAKKTFAALRKSATFNNQQTKTYVTAVMKRINELISARDALVNSSLKTQTVNATFIAAMGVIEKKYDGLVNYVNSYVTANTRINKKGKVIYTPEEIKIGKGSQMQSFLLDLQMLVDMTKQVVVTDVKGALGETVPALSQIVAQESVGRNLDELVSLIGGNKQYYIDLLKQSVVGNEKSVKIMSADKVIDKKNKTQSGTFGSIQAQIGDLEYNSTATQDKVDVVLKLPDGQSINASMKNVNLFSGFGIHILSGSNSINFLQDYPVFANHYMNIMANIGRSDPFTGSILQQAHEAMKLTIALKALAGGVLTADASGNISRNAQAEILVVNNSISGRQGFKVYFMSDLISKAANNLSLVNIEGFNSPVQYTNYWIGSQQKYYKMPSMEHAWARVAKILAQLRLQNLEVSLSPRILS